MLTIIYYIYFTMVSVHLYRHASSLVARVNERSLPGSRVLSRSPSDAAT